MKIPEKYLDPLTERYVTREHGYVAKGGDLEHCPNCHMICDHDDGYCEGCGVKWSTHGGRKNKMGELPF